MTVTHALTQIGLSELIACQHQASKLNLHDFSRRLNTHTGNMTSHLRGRGIDFSETRCYQSGDDIRCMDWRITARTGEPHVKLYQTERERPTLFATDLGRSLFFGTQVAFKSVIAARITATLAWAALQQGDRTGGIVFNNTVHHTIRPANRQRGILPLLNTLSHMTQQTPSVNQNDYFNTALSQLLPLNRPGSLIFIISDFYNVNSQTLRYLNHFSIKSDVICIFVYDALEATAPPPNRYPIHGKQPNWLDTRSVNVTKQYADHFNQRVNMIQQHCHTCAIPLLMINTAKPFLTTLHSSFGQLTRASIKSAEEIK